MNARIGQNIARLRKARGMSQAELARHLGVDQTMVSKYERGQRRIYVDALETIAQALGVPTMDLYQGPAAERQAA